MKKLFKRISQISIGALLVVGLFKSYSLYTQNILKQSVLKAESSLENHPFVILIPAHNPGEAAGKSLLSVLTQKYQNFRVIYLDNSSTDGSFESAKKLATYLQKEDKITFTQSNTPHLESLYKAIHTCKNEEIILVVDSTDFLAHESVLTRLNRLYGTPFIWMTYGSYLDYPSYKQIPASCKPFEKNVVFNNSYRSHETTVLSPVSFYAALFKKIKLDDLRYKECFMEEARSWAYALPLLEMSGKHARFVNETLYLHSRVEDEYSNSPCLEHLRKSPKYKRVKKLSLFDE